MTARTELLERMVKKFQSDIGSLKEKVDCLQKAIAKINTIKPIKATKKPAK